MPITIISGLGSVTFTPTTPPTTFKFSMSFHAPVHKTLISATAEFYRAMLVYLRVGMTNMVY
jgi:hypothetical protein